MGTLKVVLDTNVIISGLAYPSSVPGKIMAAWRSGAIDVYLSDYILEEIRRVLPKLRQRHGMTDQEIDDLVDILGFQAETIAPAELTDHGLRDGNDVPVLGTFVAARNLSGADYLITGDKDLLVLEMDSILTPANFWLRHGGL